MEKGSSERVGPSPIDKFQRGWKAFFRDESRSSADEAWKPLTVDQVLTERALARWLCLLFIVLALLRQVDRYETLEKFLHLFVFLGAAQALLGLGSYFIGDNSVLWYGRVGEWKDVTGTFLNENHFAGFMNLILPIAIGLLFRNESRLREVGISRWIFVKQFFLASATILMIVGLFFSHSRAGISIGILTLSIFLVIQLVLAGYKKRLIGFSLLLLLGALLGLLVYQLQIYPEFRAQVHSLGGQILGGSDRFLAWSGTLELIQSFFWLGAGWGTFRAVFMLYQPDSLLLTYTHPHNDYLEAFVGGGMIGGILFLGIILMPIGMYLFSCRKDIYFSRTLLMLLFSLLTMFLHGFVDFNFQIMNNLVMYVSVSTLLFIWIKFYKQRSRQ